MKSYAFVMPVLGLSLLLAAEASAIPLNLDFGAQFALRKPAAGFGAASGQAGVWNAITAFETPSGIVDLAGGATNVAVSITATFMEGLHQCQVFPFTDGCPLLDNNFYSWGDAGWACLSQACSMGSTTSRPGSWVCIGCDGGQPAEGRAASCVASI